jgi:hypothetical protein
MSRKLEVEVVEADIERLLGLSVDNLTNALSHLGEITHRWETKKGNLDDDDCRFIYDNIIAYIPEVRNAAGRGNSLATQLNNVRVALGLSEGDVPPCGC